ncbi:hypothetical protein H1R20_g14815, partial [Candolleomyces eurysporus]
MSDNTPTLDGSQSLQTPSVAASIALGHSRAETPALAQPGTSFRHPAPSFVPHFPVVPGNSDLSILEDVATIRQQLQDLAARSTEPQIPSLAHEINALRQQLATVVAGLSETHRLIRGEQHRPAEGNFAHPQGPRLESVQPAQRSRQRNALARAIRRFWKHIVHPDVPDPARIRAWDPSQGPACTIDDFRPDLTDQVNSPWNKSATMVFTDAFLSSDLPEALNADRTAVKNLYVARFRSVRRQALMTASPPRRDATLRTTRGTRTDSDDSFIIEEYELQAALSKRKSSSQSSGSMASMGPARMRVTMGQAVACILHAKCLGGILQRPNAFELLTCFIAIVVSALSGEPPQELNLMNAEHPASFRTAHLLQVFQWNFTIPDGYVNSPSGSAMIFVLKKGVIPLTSSMTPPFLKLLTTTMAVSNPRIHMLDLKIASLDPLLLV